MMTFNLHITLVSNHGNKNNYEDDYQLEIQTDHLNEIFLNISFTP